MMKLKRRSKRQKFKPLLLQTTTDVDRHVVQKEKNKNKNKHPETNIKHNSNTTLTPGSTVSSGVTVFESICSTNDKKTKVSFSDLSQKRSREDRNVSITVS